MTFRTSLMVCTGNEMFLLVVLLVNQWWRPSHHAVMSWSLVLSAVEGKGDDVKVYKVHTPFDPMSASSNTDYKVPTHATTGVCTAASYKLHICPKPCLLSEHFPPLVLQFKRLPVTGTSLWVTSQSWDALPAWSPAPAAENKCSQTSPIKWEPTPGSCASSSSCAGKRKASLTLSHTEMLFNFVCSTK